MNAPDSLALSCRHCCYYTPQGRRGGSCQLLSVAVQSSWKACSVSAPPFLSTWENLEGMMLAQQALIAEHSVTNVVGIQSQEVAAIAAASVELAA